MKTLLTRIEFMAIFSKLSPAQVLVIGFLLIILIGTGLLLLPISTHQHVSLSVVDAFFTATSALCVTGLSVVSLPETFTLFGQLVILGLIQLGGLGIMTITTLAAMVLGRKIGIRDRLFMKEGLNQLSLQGLVVLVRRIIRFSLLIQFTLATYLSIVLFPEHGFRAIYLGIWHAVSAFCNAGFDLFGNSSLSGFSTQPITLALIGFTIVLGGLGFSVLHEIYTLRSWKKLSEHAKLVLSSSLILIVLGTGMFLGSPVASDSNSNGFSVNSVAQAFFLSISSRTAGFSTFDLSSLSDKQMMGMMFLMFVGGSPASVSGGIKTTTIAIVILAVIAYIRSDRTLRLFDREVHDDTIRKAFSVFVLSLVFVVTVAFALSSIEKAPFQALFFESISAFATVGLSLGITPNLEDSSKIILSVTMFVGRVGLTSLMISLVRPAPARFISKPKARLIVG